MEIIYRKIEDLKKLGNNPRTISEEQMRILKESIHSNPDYFERSEEHTSELQSH